jgi:hypothetical protein
MEKSSVECVGFSCAYLGNVEFKPIIFDVLFHGTDDFPPDLVRTKFDGLPSRGRNLDLLNHVEPLSAGHNDSAFRGATLHFQTPTKDAGAALWTSDGWVYEIHDFPGYDINQIFEGRISDGMGRFRGSKYSGELEIAIPARVKLENIKRYCSFAQGRRGFRQVWENV